MAKLYTFKKSASVTDMAKLYTFIYEAIRKSASASASASATDMAKLYTFNCFTYKSTTLFRVRAVGGPIFCFQHNKVFFVKLFL